MNFRLGATVFVLFALLSFAAHLSAEAPSSAIRFIKDPETRKTTFVKVSPRAEYRQLAVKLTSAERLKLLRQFKRQRREDAVLIADRFLEMHKAAFGIKSVSKELLPDAPRKEETGVTHVNYIQVYNDRRVFGAGMSVHLDKDNNVQAVTPDYVPLRNFGLSSRVNEKKAQKIVVDAMKREMRLTWNPIPYETSLGILPASYIDNGKAPRTAWMIKAKSEGPGQAPSDYTWYIDAITGGVLATRTNIYGLNRVVYDCTSYYMHPTTRSCWVNQTFYDNPRYSGYPWGRQEGYPPRPANPKYGGFDNNIVYDGMGEAHDFYIKIFHRNGATGSGDAGATCSGAQCTAAETYMDEVWDAGSCPNASFSSSSSMFLFCHGMTVKDVVYHEYNHGVSYYRRGQNIMDYYDESGALSESFADFMGEAIEKIEFGQSDWVNANHTIYPRPIGDPTSAIRSAYDDLPFPDRVYSPYRYCGYEDQRGVHINSTIVSKAFYLMSEGGSFNGCDINPIGAVNAAKIFYQAVPYFSGYGETFFSAYTKFLQACNDLKNGGNGAPGGLVVDCDEAAAALQAVELDQGKPCIGVAWRTPYCRADTDGDGVQDHADKCPTDPERTAPGFGGCGNSEPAPECTQTAMGVTLQGGVAKMNYCDDAQYLQTFVCIGSSYDIATVDCRSQGKTCSSGQCG